MTQLPPWQSFAIKMQLAIDCHWKCPKVLHFWKIPIETYIYDEELSKLIGLTLATDSTRNIQEFFDLFYMVSIKQLSIQKLWLNLQCFHKILVMYLKKKVALVQNRECNQIYFTNYIMKFSIDSQVLFRHLYILTSDLR